MLEIKYHPGKVDVVADALSRKQRGMIASLLTNNQQLLRELDILQVQVILPADPCQLATLQLTSPVVDRIKERQKDDPELEKLAKKAEEGRGQDFSVKDGALWFRDRLYVPDILELKQELLKEAYNSTLVTHPGSTKMYQDLKHHY